MITCEIIKEFSEKREYFEQKLLDFLLYDTVLFYPDNVDFQKKYEGKLEAVLKSFNELLLVEYVATKSLGVVEQNHMFQEKVADYLLQLSIVDLIKIYIIATSLRSVILAILILNERIDIKDGVKIAFCEEFYSQEKWGKIDELDKKCGTIEENVVNILKG